MTDLLFPRRCPFCRKLLDRQELHLCADCRKSLPFVGDSRAPQPGEFFKACVSPLWYEGPVRSALRRFKFYRKQTYAWCFAALMAEALRRQGVTAQVLTWVPVSFFRRLRRGYDQARLLARALGKELGLRPVRTLRKVRHTAPLSASDSVDRRRASVSGVYRAVGPEKFRGKTIL